jgi:SAM-dependent methyltransferase
LAAQVGRTLNPNGNQHSMGIRDRVRALRRRHFLSLERTTPFSEEYGFDRGEPVDRIFVYDFLDRHRDDIHGSCIEVKDCRLVERFGGDRVASCEVLDIDPGNPNATIVGNLASPETLPADSFDCFVLTQTLQYVYDIERAVASAYDALARGGVLLITVPTVSKIDSEARDSDYWRLTPRGLREVAERSCPGAEIDVIGHGNVLAAAAFLYGLARHELDESRLRRTDPDFPLLACARIVRPG